MSETMSLPMASDTARSEARFITEAAKRVAEQLAFVDGAVAADLLTNIAQYKAALPTDVLAELR